MIARLRAMGCMNVFSRIARLVGPRTARKPLACTALLAGLLGFGLPLVSCQQTGSAQGVDRFEALLSGDWQRKDFGEVAPSTMARLDLELRLPPTYRVRRTTNMGMLWGVQADLDEVMALSNATLDELSFGAIEAPVFRLFASTSLTYDASLERFSGEADMAAQMKAIGMSDVEVQRVHLGNYPALIQAGRLADKLVRACAIATGDGNQVVTLLMHAPPLTIGPEAEIWSRLIDSIQTPKLGPHVSSNTLTTAEARATLDRIQQAMRITKPTKTVIELSGVVGKPSAIERPRFSQTLSLKHDKDGLLSTSMDWTASGILIEETLDGERVETNLPFPWDQSAMNVYMKRVGDNVWMGTNGKADGTSTTPLQAVSQPINGTLALIAGGPVLSSLSVADYLANLRKLYDFEPARDKGKLQGTLNEVGFRQALNAMPGAKMTEDSLQEFMRRCTQIELDYHPTSYRLLALRVTGQVTFHPSVITAEFRVEGL